MNVVIGFGKTGISCIRYLVRKGIAVIAMDSRQNPPNFKALQQEFPNVRLMVGGLDIDILTQADEIIVSPGLSLNTPELVEARSKGVPCVGDIELFAREAKAPIIAITGSNGKTTLTTLVGQMLRDAGYKAAVCGNIGAPVLDLLDKDLPDYYVMELSSFQLETTFTLNAKIAVLLNVTPDHMDRYDSLGDYAAAKLRIYADCEIAIVNIDEPFCSDITGNKITFSCITQQQTDFYLQAENDQLCIFNKGQACFPVTDLACQGQHHYQNALALLAIGTAAGVPLQSMHHTLQNFQGLPHRCQKIASSQGVDWYNDSKATNVGATIAALESLRPLYQDIILIAGGDAKGADLTPLGPVVAQLVAHVVLLGASADNLERIFKDKVDISRVFTLPEAVAQAHIYAQGEAAVLLSPACASWDMFANYEERGNLFIEAVKELIHAEGSIP